MRTSKWLASSVMLFLLMRALAHAAVMRNGDNDFHKEDDEQTSEKLLTRSKRFSMNEYLMIALSVFNVFVFFYNNVETFFPAKLKSSFKTQSQPSTSLPMVFTTSPPKFNLNNEILERNIYEENDQDNQDREIMIDQIAEMLIR